MRGQPVQCGRNAPCRYRVPEGRDSGDSRPVFQVRRTGKAHRIAPPLRSRPCARRRPRVAAFVPEIPRIADPVQRPRPDVHGVPVVQLFRSEHRIVLGRAPVHEIVAEEQVTPVSARPAARRPRRVAGIAHDVPVFRMVHALQVELVGGVIEMPVDGIARMTA